MSIIQKKIHRVVLRIKFLILFFYCISSKNEELKQISNRVVKLRKLSVFPYDFPKEYDYKSIIVTRDKDGYPYVYHNGKKLYLKKEWDSKKCQEYYNSIMVEQDYRSPHKYITNSNRMPDKEDIIADIGAAEGVFSLEVIEIVKKVYLFEADDSWLIPLNKTFEKWNNKVELVKKYVSEKDEEDSMTLDSFFRDKSVTYIKADIEGAERQMLKGATYTMKEKIKKALICTYHRHDDENIIDKIMLTHGFINEFNKGYMTFFYDKETFHFPYVRRGVLFAYKPQLEEDD